MSELKTFEDVNGEAQELATLISRNTGRSLIAAVTVPEPKEPLDELYFTRLVSWGYVFLNEAGGIVFKELARLLKAGRPDLFELYSNGKRDIQALRTLLNHNLPAESAANERTKRTAEVWLLKNGAPNDWPLRCASLLLTLSEMLRSLRDAFMLLLCDEADGTQASLDQLLSAVEKAWPPHLFDEIVAEIACEMGLPPLDAVGFRKPRQEEWAKIAALFQTREDALIAIRRVIRADIQSVFGAASA